MTTLIPDLQAAAHVADRLFVRHYGDAGYWLATAAVTTDRGRADVSRDLAEQSALAAGAARLERRDLFRLAQAGGAR